MINDYDTPLHLDDLAPEVDERAAKELFDRRRTHGRSRRPLMLSAAAVVVIVAGAAMLSQLGSTGPVIVETQSGSTASPAAAPSPLDPATSDAGSKEPREGTGDVYPVSMADVDGEVVVVDPTDDPPAAVGRDSRLGLCVEARNVFTGCAYIDEGGLLADQYSLRTAAGPPHVNESIDDAVSVVFATLPAGAATVELSYPDGSTSSNEVVISDDRSFWAAPVSAGRVPTGVTYLDANGGVILSRTDQ